jgi:hypothetical protein
MSEKLKVSFDACHHEMLYLKKMYSCACREDICGNRGVFPLILTQHEGDLTLSISPCAWSTIYSILRYSRLAHNELMFFITQFSPTLHVSAYVYAIMVVTSRHPQKTDTPTIKTTKKIGTHTKPYMKVDIITSKT